MVSTGTVRIRPEHPYGSRKPMYWWLADLPAVDTAAAPINVYVIEHTRGLVLPDTGQTAPRSPMSATSPAALPATCMTGSPAGEHRRAGHHTAQLATLGYTPSDVDTAIPSHLHQDHIGGLPGAGRLSSCWCRPPNGPSCPGPARSSAGSCAATSSCRKLKWHQIGPRPTRDPALAPFTESLDVMGDGSLVLLPTPGHTAGSMSLLVRRTGRPRCC